MTSNHDDRLAFLVSKWKKGRVKVWDYTPTHFRITLRIESRSVPGNLHLVCGDCKHIHGPFKWDNCEIEIERNPDAATDGAFVLRDRSSQFELHCSIVSAEENVEPVYSPNLGTVAQ